MNTSLQFVVSGFALTERKTMIILLLLLCLILLIIIYLLVHDVFRITKDLDYIIKNDANGIVTTSTSFPIVKKLAAVCNLNLQETHRLKEHQAIQNKKFNQMLTNLTHDIKTPLTVSMGYVQLLIRNQNGKNDSDLIRVQNNLNSVNYYLHYLMDFNLLQEKSFNLELSEFNLSNTLQTELFNYYDQLTNKGIKAAIKVTSNIVVQSDEMMFRRIFQNLIGNILKYADNEMMVSLEQHANEIQLSFTNNTSENIGNGKVLLNRFYTADTSRSNQSVGLGLSIVQSLVTTLGGKVDLQVHDNSFEIRLIFKHLVTSINDLD